MTLIFEVKQFGYVYVWSFYVLEMLFPEDGMRRLMEMEKSSGIWTMRCVLVIETRDLVILEPRPGARDKLDGVKFVVIQVTNFLMVFT